MTLSPSLTRSMEIPGTLSLSPTLQQIAGILPPSPILLTQLSWGPSPTPHQPSLVQLVRDFLFTLRGTETPELAKRRLFLLQKSSLPLSVDAQKLLGFLLLFLLGKCKHGPLNSRMAKILVLEPALLTIDGIDAKKLDVSEHFRNDHVISNLLGQVHAC